MTSFGMCFSRDFEGVNPLGHIGKKLPVYLRLLKLCQKEGWDVYVLTRKTYKGGGNFGGAWLFKDGKFEKVNNLIKVDLVFDWVGNLMFPPRNNNKLKVVNSREFKELCWNKWEAYQKLEDYMPETYWVGNLNNTQRFVGKVKTENIVLKPYNGLQGKDVFIGPKEKVKDFRPERPGRKYILQEFVDTSRGIPNLTPGKHDLRVVIINNKVVWSHIRVPAKGKMLANRAQGGALTEIDYQKVPESVKKIVKVVSQKFYNSIQEHSAIHCGDELNADMSSSFGGIPRSLERGGCHKEYDNPVFSIDFGIDQKGKPWVFEINDQIGFPRWEMKNRDVFLKALVENFRSKII